ncbi:MAG: phage portal protein [Bacteroidales bacterium]|nr:phage portal protein [Candidatus Scybalousia scybalohippi]
MVGRVGGRMFEGIFRRKKKKRSAAFLTTQEGYEILCGDGYTSLDKNPEVMAGCFTIANLISNMTIHLMENGKKGHQRIENELSRHVDIQPCEYMTRKTWMTAIVMNLLLHGDGNSVVYPHTDGGYLGDLTPIAPSRVSFIQNGDAYQISIDGKMHDPLDLLHFVYNPEKDRPWMGQGITVSLKDVVDNLGQAAATKKGFMQSKWKPSIIIKVDALADGFSSREGRRKLLSEYIETSSAGEPWLIPAEQFAVEQVRPLSLSDLAIHEGVEIDKKTVASILGVPAFILGVGEFNAQEWNNFISTTVHSVALIIQQEMTKKLLMSPKWYWKFNMFSLYSYDIKTISDVFGTVYDRGIVTGNEVRDKMGMSPIEGLDKLVILENYIPVDKVGEQQKLKGADNGE